MGRGGGMGPSMGEELLLGGLEVRQPEKMVNLNPAAEPLTRWPGGVW